MIAGFAFLIKRLADFSLLRCIRNDEQYLQTIDNQNLTKI